MALETTAFGVLQPGDNFQKLRVQRRELKVDDVWIKILYCGICHSDLSQIYNEWGYAEYPLVPGHEIVGRVVGVGSDVKTVKIGDIGAVGCLVDSCGFCDHCNANEENYCPKKVATYGSKQADGTRTIGGYSYDVVVKEAFVCVVPPELHHNLAGVAPLLCAGITTYSPIMRHRMNEPGKKIAVVGLGGLGHMAVQFLKAFKNHVAVISSSETKRKDAEELLGVTDYINAAVPAQMAGAAGKFDFIIDTVSARRNVTQLVGLLKVGGIIVMVGLPEKNQVTMDLRQGSLVVQRKGIFGSLIGGIQETQEMLDMCAEFQIFSLIETIQPNEISDAIRKMQKSIVRFRYVIDFTTTSDEESAKVQ